MTETTLKTGDHVRLLHDVGRYPHFIAPAGATGTVTAVEDGLVRVRMDETLAGAEEWENEVHWYLPNGDDADADLAVVRVPATLGEVASILRDYLASVLRDASPTFDEDFLRDAAIEVAQGRGASSPDYVAIGLDWQVTDDGTGETGPSVSFWPALGVEVAQVEDRWAIRFTRSTRSEHDDEGRESGWLVLACSALGDAYDLASDPTSDEVATAVADLLSTLYPEGSKS